MDPPPSHYLLESPNVTNTGLISFDRMVGGNYYTLLVVAEDENVPAENLHQRFGLRAHQTYYKASTSYLYVVDAGLSGNSITENTELSYNGDIWIMFSDSLHYRYVDPNDPNKEVKFRVDSCHVDSGTQHDLFADRFHLSSNKYLRFDDVMESTSLSLNDPKPGQAHDQLLKQTLTFSTTKPIIAGPNGTLLITFNGQLCDSGGRVRAGTPQLMIKLYRTPIPNSTQVSWEVKVDPVISSSWTSATG